MSSTIITFFNEHGCRSSLLPAIENADHDIVLYEKWFWLEEDVKVLLECVKGQWILKSNNPCRIYQWMRGRLMPVEGNYALQDGVLLQFVTADDEKINALIRCRDSLLSSALHIPLSHLRRIRIGTGHQPSDYAQVDWVLGHFPPDQTSKMADAFDRAARAAAQLLTEEPEKVMSTYNRKQEEE